MSSCESESQTHLAENDHNSFHQQQMMQNQDADSNQQCQKHEDAPCNFQLEIERATQEEFLIMLQPISELIKNRKDLQMSGSKVLHLKLVKLFLNIYKRLTKTNQNQEFVIFVLSLLAEIVRQHPKVKLPFSRKIVLALLTFDVESVQKSVFKIQLTAILSILLDNLAKQAKLVLRLRVQNQLKEGLLKLLGKVESLMTLRILLHAINYLKSACKLQVSSSQFDKNGVYRQMIDMLGVKAANQLRVRLCHSSKARPLIEQRKTLLELISE